MPSQLLPPTDSGHQRRNRPNPQIRRLVGGACLASVLTAFACSLLYPLDYVGDSAQSNAADASMGANSGKGGEAGAGNDAGTVDEAGKAGAGPITDSCGNSCGSDQQCKDGVCTCPSGKTLCDGVCTDSVEDAGYCGSCGVTCRSDQSCVDGGCTCVTAGETACPTACADLSSDLQNCGSCDNSCKSGQACDNGTCRSSPCDGYCANAESLSEGSDGFRIENIGQAERCFAVSKYLPSETNTRIVCWNFDPSRKLYVNGDPVLCLTGSGVALAAKNNGWYCIQVGSGGTDQAGLVLPNR
jgi:hypothetical protein